MDFLPIPPSSTNKVNTAINLANDGGSKSNTGYLSKRGSSEETQEGSVDEVTLSTSSSAENEEIVKKSELIKFINLVKNILKKIKEFVIKLLGLNKPKVENIFKNTSSETF